MSQPGRFALKHILQWARIDEAEDEDDIQLLASECEAGAYCLRPKKRFNFFVGDSGLFETLNFTKKKFHGMVFLGFLGFFHAACSLTQSRSPPWPAPPPRQSRPRQRGSWLARSTQCALLRKVPSNAWPARKPRPSASSPASPT